MAERRRYSDRERAEALAVLDSNGGDASHTARQTGIPRKTLAEWANGRHSADVADLRQEKKEGMADAIDGVIHELVEEARAKAKGADLKDIAVAFGIFVDKSRLLREEPTSIARSEAGRSVEEARAALAELREWESANGQPPAEGAGQVP